MAIYDIDGVPTSSAFWPSDVKWVSPPYTEKHNAQASQSIYWPVVLTFSQRQAATWEYWAAFNDFEFHTIDLPSQADQAIIKTYTGVIKIDQQPSYESVNPGDFAMIIGPVDIT